jgi:hypothetical protein
MGPLTDLEQIHEGINGDLYESHQHMLLGRPLDFGRTLYVKLKRAFAQDGSAEVEVYWNHFDNRLTAEIKIETPVGGWKGYKSYTSDEFDAREMKLAQINEFVTEIKNEVYKSA